MMLRRESLVWQTPRTGSPKLSSSLHPFARVRVFLLMGTAPFKWSNIPMSLLACCSRSFSPLSSRTVIRPVWIGSSAIILQRLQTRDPLNRSYDHDYHGQET